MTNIDAWFTEIDDGTLIVIGVEAAEEEEGQVLKYHQNSESGGCDLLETDELEFDEPLPSDFVGNTSASLSRFADRISLFLDESTPSRVEEDTDLINTAGNAPGRGNILTFGKNYISRYDFVNVESLGTSTGGAGQVFTVSGSIILTPTKGTPTIFIGGVDGTKWVVVDDLSLAGPSDRVFMYDESIGEVTFGNGVHGAIPEKTLEVVLRISIRDSGGLWQFAGIVVDPQIEVNRGVIKSAQDKIYYAKSKIACVEASSMETVHSVLNGIRIDTVYQPESPHAGILWSRREIWELGFGGEATTDGGEIVIKNTGAAGFVKDKPTGPGFRGPTIDLTKVYPTLRMSTEGALAFVFPLRPSKMEGGAVTNPKRYIASSYFYPIFRVEESFAYDTPDTTASYSLSFHVPADGGEVTLDTDGTEIRRQTKPIAIGANRGSPECIRMGHLLFTYDDPLPADFPPHSIFSTPPNALYRAVLGSSSTTFSENFYRRVISDSNVSHIEDVVVVYETQATELQKKLFSYYFGQELEDFITTYDFEKGDIIFTRVDESNPN